MMLYIFFILFDVVHSCKWPSPAQLFPPGLVHIEPHGLDDMGTSHYSVVFDDSKTVSGMTYIVKSVNPTLVTYDQMSSDNQLQISHAAPKSLEWNDILTITVTASSQCAPGYELGHSPYRLNITSYVQIFHTYNDTLSPTTEQWTNDGWRSRSHLTLYPWSSSTYVVGREFVTGPCPGAWIKSEIHIMNTSHYTFWNPVGASQAFVGGPNNLPRCHRPDMGNVCIIQARTRLTWLPECQHNVAIWQSVSQIARLTPTIHETEYPANFDTDRRLPAPDNNDLRYDMCKSVLCTSEGNCHTFHHENTQLAADGEIFIRQQHTKTTTSIEIVCEFEVVGFLDNIWSPHIYMRKWYGYEWY